MLLHYGLIKVLRVKAYTQGTFRLAGVSEHYQAVGLVTGAITPFKTMSSKAFSIWSLYSIGTFHLAEMK